MAPDFFFLVVGPPRAGGSRALWDYPGLMKHQPNHGDTDGSAESCVMAKINGGLHAPHLRDYRKLRFVVAGFMWLEL